MTHQRRPGGFSLIELIVALALASLVLVAVVGISTSVVRFQMEGIRKGTVTGWSLISYAKMAKDIEDANVLVYPRTPSMGTSADDILVACANWGGRTESPYSDGDNLDPNKDVEVFYYCFNQGEKTIWRYYRKDAALTCPVPTAPRPACDGSAPGGYEATLMAANVQRADGDSGTQKVFTRDDSIGGVKISYVVGEQAATDNRPIPVYTPIELGVSMQKQYVNTLD